MKKHHFEKMIKTFSLIQDENQKFAELGINLLNTKLFQNYYRIVESLWIELFGKSNSETLKWYFFNEGYKEISVDHLYRIVCENTDYKEESKETYQKVNETEIPQTDKKDQVKIDVYADLLYKALRELGLIE